MSAMVFLGCGGPSGPRAGSEGGNCFPNDTCSAGLTCLSTFCVRVVLPGMDGGVDGKAGGGGATGSGGASGSGGAAGTGVAGTGAGGAAGVSVDAGVPEVNFTPAAHPDLPQVGTAGGPVLVTPKVRPIIYVDEVAATDIQAFLQELTHTSYWASVTAEYGVGALTVLPPIMILSSAPKVTTDSALQSQLVANTSGSNPLWGAADPNVVYMYIIPSGATVNIQTSTCCDDFGGYHSEVTSGAVAVPYSVVCSCPGFLGATVSPIDERTTAMSHELVEAATDPFPASNPGYGIEDHADIVWTVINGGGEVADMCAFNDDAYFIPSGSTYMVQRSWSNAAAKKMQNPCVPYAKTALYFNSFPALDMIAYTTDKFLTRGLRIPIGQSRTVDVNLFSNAPTKGPWTVTALDYDSWFYGLKPTLKLSLDKTSGQNGDTLHLTVTPSSADPNLQGEVFILYSQYGTVRDPDYQTNLTVSLVVN
jgi:hypothetical protein